MSKGSISKEEISTPVKGIRKNEKKEEEEVLERRVVQMRGEVLIMPLLLLI
jgi:hypothetical protein